MVIRTLFGWGKQAKAREILKEKANERASGTRAGEMTEISEEERPEYSPEEHREIDPIWAEPLAENEPSGKEIGEHIDSFFEKHPVEHVRTLAFYCLRYGYDLPAEKARKYADIVAANKHLLYGGFQTPDVYHKLVDDAKRMKQGVRERNWVKIVLDNPSKYRDIFERFRRKPPGGVEFMTEEEWARRPQRRRSGPSTI